jgi:hypothetical protein
MLKWQLLRLLSVAIPPLAGLAAGTTVTAVAITPSVAQDAGPTAESCFVGVDYNQLSLSELRALVTRAVSQLDPNMAGDDIALEIGRQIGASAVNCTPAQIRALAQNVAIILAELGLAPSGNILLADLVALGISPTTASTTATDDLIVPPLTVYG